MTTQYLSTIVPQASGIPAANGTRQTVAKLALPDGQWIVDGELWCAVNANTVTLTNLVASLAITPIGAGLVVDPTDAYAANVLEIQQAKQSGSTVGWVLPLVSLYLDAAATVYLEGKATWTGTGTLLHYGKISAHGIPAAITTPGFVYLHTTDGTLEGYVNKSMIQYIRPDPASSGSIIQIDNRVLIVTETPDFIASSP